MTLVICENQFLPTVLVNKMGKCGQCLAKFVSATWMDQSLAEFSESLSAMQFYNTSSYHSVSHRLGKCLHRRLFPAQKIYETDAVGK